MRLCSDHTPDARLYNLRQQHLLIPALARGVVSSRAVNNERTSFNPATPLLFTAVALSATALVAIVEAASQVRTVTLFLGFEGTALLASVLLDTLLCPPAGSDLWEWLFVPQRRTIGVVLKQPLFYLGVIFLVFQDALKGLC
ncbi:MAG: hypothetical protein ACE15E_04820 [Acidobacteriota bacterium]